MRVEYDFLRVGSFVEPRRGHIFVDVGNQNLTGVIDTHTETSQQKAFECSSSLIVSNPSLVTQWISAEDLRSSVHVVMHENPDYDCIASSLLVRSLLEAQAAGKVLPDGWNEWAPVIADSARRIDRGETRVRLPIKNEPLPITPYLSLMALHDHLNEQTLVPKESWRLLVLRGQRILERAVRLATARGLGDLELIDLRGSLDDLGELERIIDQKVQAFDRDARRIGLGTIFEHHKGESEGVFRIELPDRNSPSTTLPTVVACIREPECGPGFFKSMIRGAYRDSIGATFVFLTVPADPLTGTPSWVRSIISVDPDSPYDLRGLGRHLDLLETEVRSRQGMKREGRPRPGFDNPDPWYDGRALMYTIVDAPRWGTVLSPVEVLNEFHNVRRWLAVRLRDMVEERLGAIAFGLDAGDRRRAHQKLATAVVEFWQSETADNRSQLYVDSIDAVSYHARRGDTVPLSAADDVLLGLLANRDPEVRVQALALAARNAARVTAYSRGCSREDVVALLAIMTKDPEEAAKHLRTGTIRAEHALLIDAVTARLAISGPDDRILHAAATLAASNSDLPLVRRSVLNLWLTLRRIDPDRATQFEGPAQEIVTGALRGLTDSAESWDLATDSLNAHLSGVREDLEQRAKGPDDIGRAVAHLILGERSEAVAALCSRLENAAEFREWLAKQPTAGAALHLLVLVAGGGIAMLAEQQRTILLQASSDLLERVHADDHPTTPLIGELVARLREAFGSCRLLDVLSASAVTSALASSPELVGGLIRLAHFRSDARLVLLKAAVAGTSRSVLASARSAVLTPHDAGIWQNVQVLARAAGAARTCNAAINVVVPAAHARGVSLLLAAAATARGERQGSATLDVLAGVAEDADLQSAVDHLDAARTLIAEDLRHVAPDHILLADAEASLAKAETFARAIALIGPPENMTENALKLLLRLALTLPDLDQEALRGLLLLRCGRRTDHESPWTTGALDLATILESIVHDGHVVADVARIRNACGSLSALASSCSADALGWLVQTAIVDIEAAFSRYGTYLERAANERESLSLEVLQASALVTFACDFPGMAAQGDGIAAVELLARLTQTQPDALPRILCEVRRKAGRAKENKRWVAAAQKVVDKTDPIRAVTVNATYERLRELLMMPLAQLDAIYARIVDADLQEYNFSSARRRIDEYSFNRVRRLLSFWMSGWTVAIPIMFVLLCAAAAYSWPFAEQAVEISILLLIAAVAASIGLEWQRRHRTANTIVDSMRYRLFLPHYGVPVLIGVYSAAMSHEMSSHLALQLDDIRYAALGVGLFATAAWALRQIIRRDKHTVSKRNAIIAAARLFAYGFVIAIFLNLFVAPLFRYEDKLHNLIVWMTSGALAHQAFIPHKLSMPLFITDVPLFPRHIVLHALFGMFVGIFLHRFLRTSEEE